MLFDKSAWLANMSNKNVMSLLIFSIFLTQNAIAFNGGDYTIDAPAKWAEQANAYGADIIFMAPYKDNEQTPMVAVVTVKAALPKVKLGDFLKQIVKKQHHESDLAKTLVISGDGDLKKAGASGHWIEYEFQKGDKTMKAFGVLFPTKSKEYHLYLYTAAKEYYGDYIRDVKVSAASFKNIGKK